MPAGSPRRTEARAFSGQSLRQEAPSRTYPRGGSRRRTSMSRIRVRDPVSRPTSPLVIMASPASDDDERAGAAERVRRSRRLAGVVQPVARAAEGIPLAPRADVLPHAVRKADREVPDLTYRVSRGRSATGPSRPPRAPSATRDPSIGTRLPRHESGTPISPTRGATMTDTAKRAVQSRSEPTICRFRNTAWANTR